MTAPGAHTFPFHRGDLTTELIARAAHRAGLTHGDDRRPAGPAGGTHDQGS